MERPDLYVLARFLDILYDNRHLKKTNLQMRLGLNYPRFVEYLQWMISHGLVQQQTDEDGTEIYLLSPQGYDAPATSVLDKGNYVRDANLTSTNKQVVDKYS